MTIIPPPGSAPAETELQMRISTHHKIESLIYSDRSTEAPACSSAPPNPRLPLTRSDTIGGQDVSFTPPPPSHAHGVAAVISQDRRRTPPMKPRIIFIQEPSVVHTHPSDFLRVVQSLTGASNHHCSGSSFSSFSSSVPPPQPLSSRSTLAPSPSLVSLDTLAPLPLPLASGSTLAPLPLPLASGSTLASPPLPFGSDSTFAPPPPTIDIVLANITSPLYHGCGDDHLQEHTIGSSTSPSASVRRPITSSCSSRETVRCSKRRRNQSDDVVGNPDRLQESKETTYPVPRSNGDQISCASSCRDRLTSSASSYNYNYGRRGVLEQQHHHVDDSASAPTRAYAAAAAYGDPGPIHLSTSLRCTCCNSSPNCTDHSADLDHHSSTYHSLDPHVDQQQQKSPPFSRSSSSASISLNLSNSSIITTAANPMASSLRPTVQGYCAADINGDVAEITTHDGKDMSIDQVAAAGQAQRNCSSGGSTSRDSAALELENSNRFKDYITAATASANATGDCNDIHSTPICMSWKKSLVNLEDLDFSCCSDIDIEHLQDYFRHN